MEQGSVLVELKKMKSELQSLIVEMQGKASKEDLFVFRLEDSCNCLKSAVINSTLNLPSISSFRFYFSKLKSTENIEYILGLLHECWILTHPDKMFDSSYKDDDPIAILENSLCKYSDNSSYDVVSEEMNTPINIVIADTYYRKVQENEMLYLFREYLGEVYKAVNDAYNGYDFIIEKGFMPVCCLKVALSREQLRLLFSKVSQAGFMKDDEATCYSFLSLFSNTLHSSYGKIIWLDRNEKNNQPAVASLYAMFSAMGVVMNKYNKNIICKHFNDANNNPISPDSLKDRKDSSTLQKIKKIIAACC